MTVLHWAVEGRRARWLGVRHAEGRLGAHPRRWRRVLPRRGPGRLVRLFLCGWPLPGSYPRGSAPSWLKSKVADRLGDAARGLEDRLSIQVVRARLALEARVEVVWLRAKANARRVLSPGRVDFEGKIRPIRPAYGSCPLRAVLPDLVGIGIALLVILGLALVSIFWSAGRIPIPARGVILGFLRRISGSCLRSIAERFPLWLCRNTLGIFGCVVSRYFCLLCRPHHWRPQACPGDFAQKDLGRPRGAVAGSALVSFIFAGVTQLTGIGTFAAFAGCLAVVEQAGDLLEFISQAISWG